MNNELIGVISNEGELKGVLEDNSFNVIVQIMETGPQGPQGPPGPQGPQGEKGEKGDKGDDGRGIVSIVRTSGTGAAGTYDTYTISFTDGSTTTYQVYNGKDGAKTGYVHIQIAAATTWDITHNLDKHPSVTVVDTGGNVVVGDVEYLTTSHIRVHFSAEFSGKAYLN